MYKSIASLAAVAALSLAGVASAAPAKHHHTAGHTIHRPVVVKGGKVAAISAFPTGGKGSGTEATCALWSGQLNQDQGAVDATVENNDLQGYQDASASLEQDKSDALDAGCVVID